MSAAPIHVLGAPLARIVAGNHDRGLVEKYGLIGDLRRYGSSPVLLVDGAEVRRERRRPFEQALVELQPLRLAEGDSGGNPAVVAVHGDEPAGPRRGLPQGGPRPRRGGPPRTVSRSRHGGPETRGGP